jgi:hypothetical protein
MAAKSMAEGQKDEGDRALDQRNVGGGLSGLSMALFTRALGWKPEEVELFLADVKKEINDTKIHAWAPM